MSTSENTAGSIQKIAEAIAAVLKLDVTILDEELVRIAGTGEYRDRVGSRVGEDSSFGRALRTGETVAVENPGLNEACRECPVVETCQETAHVCSPIKSGGTSVGVIGLTAFDQQQKRRLLHEEDSYLEFVSKMSELIASKLSEEKMLRELLEAQGHLQAIANSVYEGIVAVKGDGRLSFLNPSARQILRLPTEAKSGVPPELTRAMGEVLTSGEGYAHREISVQSRKGLITLISSAAPILSEGKVIGAVSTLEDIGEVHELVYQLSEGQPDYTFSTIVGRSPVLEECRQKARKAARGGSTILIRGESGTGKELFARAIHAESQRAKGPFIAVNCAAIPEPLLESELFGYADGAFTGARRGGKPGKFELANHGTLFLDEIGDMSLRLQAKLLRVVQQGEIERVGGTRTVRLDVRVIAATHRNLEDMMEKREFREDLYYRLNVIPIEIPPLRARIEDVLLLLNYFRERYNHLLGKKTKAFSRETLQMLLGYPWPGNVRELENAVEYAINMAAGEIITADCVPRRIHQAAEGQATPGIRPLCELEREQLARGLQVFGRSEKGKLELAQRLGMSRATLYRKLKKYNLGETTG